MNRLIWLVWGLTMLPLLAVADPPPEEDELLEMEEPIRLPPVVVSSTPEDLSTLGGSAHLLEEETLEAFEYDDPNQVLYSVPGVYVRQEDAYGLRPNIGLRGVNSERSKKVTLMEDGLLFGPAPYSAPAAYYFPLMTRVVGMEVFKGPSAILYGPQTIGGAINLITRDIPQGQEIGVDLAYGLDHYHKVHAHYGWGVPRGGILFEGVHLMTNGFKELDGGGDTGFMKQELMFKGRWASDPLEDVFHRGDIKLGFSHEQSNETYLGLSDADFEANPYRRYAASALDQMNLMRFQVEAGYTLQVGEDFDVNLRFYWHDLTRSWQKVGGFAGGTSLADILADPTGGKRQVYYDVLTGAQDSSSSAEELLLGTNAREFTVLGGQLEARYAFETGPVSHELRLGARVHFDQVERDHTEDNYRMEGGAMVATGASTQTTTANRGRANAVASFLHYALHTYGLTLKPGVRMEYVETSLLDRTTDALIENDHLTLLPGVGIHYEILDGLGLLAGVYRGFSPVSPGQAAEVLPETSVNYEFGVRYALPESSTLLEAIAFYSDYSNLVGECSFSAGCEVADLDRQFNAGEVDIVGVEVVLGHTFELPADLRLPVRLTYTYTHGEFKTPFVSENPQFGEVEVGDQMPYVPPHQGALHLGIGAEVWDFDVNTTFVDSMREVAGGDDAPDSEKTDRMVLLDVTARYRPLEWMEVYLKGENLLNSQPIVSRRPYGARPGKPLLASGGIKLSW